jgi:hypothetical protein
MNRGILKVFVDNRSLRCTMPTPSEDNKSPLALSFLPCGIDIGGSENQADGLFYFPLMRRPESQIVRPAFNSMKDRKPTTETPDMQTELSHSVSCGCSTDGEGAIPCRFPALLRPKRWRAQGAKGLVSDASQYGYFIIVPKRNTSNLKGLGVVTPPSRCLSFPEAVKTIN